MSQGKIIGIFLGWNLKDASFSGIFSFILRIKCQNPNLISARNARHFTICFNIYLTKPKLNQAWKGVMSGRNNQKVNFNLRRWNTVVGFRADTDTHSRRMPSLHMHACQAIIRNFIATKRHLWRKNKLPKPQCTPMRSKLYARKKSHLTRSLYFMAIIIMIITVIKTSRSIITLWLGGVRLLKTRHVWLGL